MDEYAFTRLKPYQKHKYLATLLREIWEGLIAGSQVLPLFTIYNKRSDLPPIEFQKQAIANRFYHHQKQSGFRLNEQNFLQPIYKKDNPSNAPFLPIAIYLDNLRSSFNVGSIIRTNEAFRLGFIHFGKQTPTLSHPKVQKTAMGCAQHTPATLSCDLKELPRPIIGLETAKKAVSIETFSFPKVFTLAIGNEELGLSQETLDICDALICIDLKGYKNSLNVSAAFAIAAQMISQQAKTSNRVVDPQALLI